MNRRGFLGITWGGQALAKAASTADDYRKTIEEWRARQEANLKSDTGWLTVVGLTWLKEGRNELEFPGWFERRGVLVLYHAPEGGAPQEMKPDSEGAPTVIKRGSKSAHVIRRGERLGIRLRDTESALRRNFTGRKWYPVKPEYRIEARWIPYQPPKTLIVPNIIGDKTEEKCPGAAEFTLHGKIYRLEPTQSGDSYFFVFRDLTAGKETYGAGRFLYAGLAQNGKVILDFNRAVNPPCAFTPYATCPLPPAQNRLQVRIEAGELKYGDH